MNSNALFGITDDNMFDVDTRESKRSCPYHFVEVLSMFDFPISRTSLSSSSLLQKYDPTQQHHPIIVSNNKQLLEQSDSVPVKIDEDDHSSSDSRKRKYASNSHQFTPLATKLPSNSVSSQSNSGIFVNEMLRRKHRSAVSSSMDSCLMPEEENDLSSTLTGPGVATVSLSSSIGADLGQHSITVVRDSNNTEENQISSNEVGHLTELRRLTRNQREVNAKKRLLCPVQLMIALLEQGTYESIVAWLPDGRSFVIVDRDRFMSQIVKPGCHRTRTFSSVQYDSFVRKLHRWGFARLLPGSGLDVFHHPFFQRDNPDLVTLIDRGNQSKHTEAMEKMHLDFPPSLAGVEKFYSR